MISERKRTTEEGLDSLFILLIYVMLYKRKIISDSIKFTRISLYIGNKCLNCKNYPNPRTRNWDICKFCQKININYHINYKERFAVYVIV